MKQRAFAFSVLLSFVLALASAAMVSQRAAAQCYNQQQQPVPCPSEKKKKVPPTDIPKPTPSPVPSPEAVSQPVACTPPDQSQLAALCANLPAASGSNSNPGGSPSVGNPNAPNTAGFRDFEFGGGGVLLGVLVALLVPALLRGLNGNGRSSLAPPPPGIGSLAPPPPGIGSLAPPPPGSAGSSDSPLGAYDAFHKTSDDPLGAYDAFQKARGADGSTGAPDLKYETPQSGTGTQEAGGADWIKGRDASGQDLFHKHRTSSTDGGNTWDKSSSQGMQDMDSKFAKGSDAGPGGGPAIGG